MVIDLVYAVLGVFMVGIGMLYAVDPEDAWSLDSWSSRLFGIEIRRNLEWAVRSRMIGIIAVLVGVALLVR